MREIKFRVYDKDASKGIDPMVLFNFSRREEIELFASVSQGRPIMQYTGLKDKNGKEIYFDDILRTHIPGNFVIKEDNYELLNALEKKLYSVEVIGNIYENPELIKGRS